MHTRAMDSTWSLPGGYLDEAGNVHREAEVIALSGREEELLAARAPSSSAAAVTEVLSRCVRRIGDVSPVTHDVARSLVVADRQYLLLALRALTFGDQVQGSITCPRPQCGADIDIDFSIHDIPVARIAQHQPSYTTTLSPAARRGAEDEVPEEIAFRLPNGEDQELLSPYLEDNEAHALHLLLARCIHTDEGTSTALVSRLSPRACLEIERAIASTAPRVTLDMDLSCIECARPFVAPFELQDFFFAELRTSRDLLFREVHYLAYHYHWSEREILDMPRDKRHTYIEILAEEMERLNHGE